MNITARQSSGQSTQQSILIFGILATVELVFSGASNIINKKQARLPPETVNLLIFLQQNQEFGEG